MKSLNIKTANCYCLLLLCPLALSAQNGITISNFAAAPGTGNAPTTLTFDIQWSPPAEEKVWSDTVWVFVDYNNAGAMTRLPLALNAGATLTQHSAAGQDGAELVRLEEVPGNPHGVWVVGNARATQGAFTATVQLVETWRATSLHGLCIYAINYPPVAQYIAADEMKFTGTPDFLLTFTDNSAATVLRAAAGTYVIPDDKALKSFTDASLAPGVTFCKVPSTQSLTASAAGYCAGAAGVQLALGSTERGAVYQLYNGETSLVSATITGTGGAATFSNNYTAGSYSVRVKGSAAFCAATVAGTLTIKENPTPTAPSISQPANICQNSGSLTFVASDYTGALTWTATGGGVVSGNSVTISGTAAGDKTVTARSTQTYTGAPTCYSATVTQSAEVNPLPTVQSSASATRCGSGAVSITATPSTGVIDWYTVSAGGTSVTTSNTYTTPSLSASTTYYAQARNSATQCLSARTAVAVTILTVPAISGTAPSTICYNTTAALTATATDGTTTAMTYTWVIGGSSCTTTASTTTLSNLMANTSYTVTVTNADGCVSAQHAGTISVISKSVAGVAPNDCGCADGTLLVGAVCQSVPQTSCSGLGSGKLLLMLPEVTGRTRDGCAADCAVLGARLPTVSECSTIYNSCGGGFFFMVSGGSCDSSLSYRVRCDKNNTTSGCYEHGQPCRCVK